MSALDGLIMRLILAIVLVRDASRHFSSDSGSLCAPTSYSAMKMLADRAVTISQSARRVLGGIFFQSDFLTWKEQPSNKALEANGRWRFLLFAAGFINSGVTGRPWLSFGCCAAFLRRAIH